MMTSPQKDGEWRLIQSLERCEGWTGWMVPKMEKRLEEIKALLLDDSGDVVTTRLRTEYRFLREWMAKPVQVRGVLEAKAGG